MFIDYPVSHEEKKNLNKYEYQNTSNASNEIK